MCGINGIFAYHYAANSIDRSELFRTRDHMSARGPDGSGAWVSGDERTAFGHRRLAIIDLSEGGAQPMSNADGSLVITFNGEIYNYKELRSRLEGKGHRFRSQSDTEVLLHLYADQGEQMVHSLRGMFAFAIFDEKKRQVFLARDPYGIKPLYYVDDGWTFRFASQVKALLAGGAVSREPDPAGQVGFYLFGSVPEPFTTYLAVRSLPAGSTMTVDRIGARAPASYHSISTVLHEGELHQSVGQGDGSEVRAALIDSVRSHLVADVPVGLFLSAGVDSGVLLGLMREAGQENIQTVTVAFNEQLGTPNDEAPIAKTVALHYGAQHTTRVVTRGEFEDDLPLILDAMDQPTIDGVNTWFASKAARELGIKTAISGVGGDELFAGYPSFIDVPRWVCRVRCLEYVPMIKAMSRVLGAKLTGPLGYHPKLASILELGGSYPGAYLLRRGVYLPWELDGLMDPEFVRRGLERLAPFSVIGAALAPSLKTPQAKVTALESGLYLRNQLLRDTDWASMAHSIEVRTPLVDSSLLERCARQPRLAKSALANSLEKKLPTNVTDREKTGFTTPVYDWALAGSSRACPKSTHASFPVRHYLQFVAGATFGNQAA